MQATLIELVDLSLLGKQLHWSAVGPLFRPLHEHLDEFVPGWDKLAHTVAERAFALGFAPDGHAAAVSAGSDSPAVERAALDAGVVVRELVPQLATSPNATVRMDRLGELDLASQDVLIEVHQPINRAHP